MGKRRHVPYFPRPHSGDHSGNSSSVAPRPASGRYDPRYFKKLRGLFLRGRPVLTQTGRPPDASGGALPRAGGAQRLVIGPTGVMLAALLPEV